MNFVYGDPFNKMMQLVLCGAEEVPLRHSRDTMVGSSNVNCLKLVLQIKAQYLKNKIQTISMPLISVYIFQY